MYMCMRLGIFWLILLSALGNGIICRWRDILRQCLSETEYNTGWAKKTAHGFLCYNFPYSQSFFIICGTYTL